MFSRSHISYSKPDSGDEPGADYDSIGHVDTPLLDRLGVTRDADFYLCGPPSFLKQLTAGLKTWGADSTRIHSVSACLGCGNADHAGNCAIPPTRRLTLPRGNPAPDLDFIHPKRTHGSVGLHGFPVCWNKLAEACDVPGHSGRAAQGVCHTPANAR